MAVWLALPVIAGAAVLFAQLRHLPLAIGGAAVAPLPGLIAAAVAAKWIAAAHLGLLTIALAWMLGASVAQLLASEVVLHILEGSSANDAMQRAWRNGWPAGIAAIVVGCLAVAAAMPDRHGLIQAASTVSSGLSAFLVLPFARWLPFGEDFVVRANRLRERRERLFDPLIAVARPRWGFSAGGIALVFAVLAVFGLRQFARFPVPLYVWPVALALLAAASAAVIRDWRATISTVAAMFLTAAIGFWIAARLGLRDVPDIFMALAAGLVPVLALAGHAGRFFHEGDDATIGLARMLTRDAPVAGFAGVLLAAAALAAAPLAGKLAVVLLAVFVFTGAAALVFQPALTVVIETLFPRKATLEARYRVR